MNPKENVLTWMMEREPRLDFENWSILIRSELAKNTGGGTE